MRKVVKEQKMEILKVEVNKLGGNKLVVGLYKKRDNLILVFPFYSIHTGRYKVNTSYYGKFNNSGFFGIEYTTLCDVYEWMMNSCEHVYELDSWNDLAKIINEHNPVLEQES